MHAENSIVIRAPRARIFETAADLSRWPVILPHYRWIRYLEKSPNRNLVVMAARRGMIPIHWTSEQVIDAQRGEIHFHHLKAFTKGMSVKWTFAEKPEGVEVRIAHDLKPLFPLIGTFVSDTIVGNFFVRYVASRTLHHLKLYLEKGS